MLLKTAGGRAARRRRRSRSPASRTTSCIRTWIGQGVKLDLNAPRVQVDRDVPQEPDASRRSGTKQQFAVLATYTDGTRPRRDRRSVHR